MSAQVEYRVNIALNDVTKEEFNDAAADVLTSSIWNMLKEFGMPRGACAVVEAITGPGQSQLTVTVGVECNSSQELARVEKALHYAGKAHPKSSGARTPEHQGLKASEASAQRIRSMPPARTTMTTKTSNNNTRNETKSRCTAIPALHSPYSVVSF